MSSSLFLINRYPSDTIATSLANYSKRSLPNKPAVVTCRSSLPPLISNSNRKNNSKLWTASLGEQQPADPFNCIRVNSRTEVAAGSDEEMDKVSAFIDVCRRFSRPFAIIGTIIQTISMAARVWIENAHLVTASLPLKALVGFIAVLCCDLFINGINQIYDVDIDKINKPFLPLASGEISLKSAWRIVLYLAAAGLLLVLLNESGLFLASLYCLELLIGYLYSVPPFRLKRFPPTAFLVLITLPSLLNIGIYFASRAVLGLAIGWSPALSFISFMTFMFGVVFSMTKDLSDIEGDSKFGVETFATKLGSRNMAFIGIGTLLLTYIAAICAAIFMPQAGFKLGIFIPAHIILALILLFKGRELDKANYSAKASLEFYMFLWQLKYAEHMLFPFM